MKRLTLVLAVIVAFGAFVIADECGNDQMKDQTVEEIKQLQEGDSAKLEGKLSEGDQENIYLFTDDTGEINVEITPEIWGDLQFNPDQKYEIKGEVAQDELGDLHVKANEVEEGKTQEEIEQKRLEQQQKRDEARQRGMEKRQNQQDQGEEDSLF